MEPNGEVSLPGLLKFITGLSVVPPMGMNNPITIQYQLNDKTAFLPRAQACFSYLILPVCHENRDDFFDAMIKGLEFGGGYGNS